MPGDLAWSTSSSFDVTWPAGMPDPGNIPIWSFSIPPQSDLGALSTLVFLSASRGTCNQNGATNWQYGLVCSVTVSGVTVDVDRAPFSNYETNAHPGFIVGDKYSTYVSSIFKHDFRPGATVSVAIDPFGRWRQQGVISVALLRDFTALDDRGFDFLGGGTRHVVSSVSPSPLVPTPPGIVGPAPWGILSLYASDSWSASEPPAVSIANTPGWEDLTTAVAGIGLRAALGLYTPQVGDPDSTGYLSPDPYVSGVLGSQAAETFGVYTYAGNATVTPMVAVPSRLATIVG